MGTDVEPPFPVYSLLHWCYALLTHPDYASGAWPQHTDLPVAWVLEYGSHDNSATESRVPGTTRACAPRRRIRAWYDLWSAGRLLALAYFFHDSGVWVPRVGGGSS